MNRSLFDFDREFAGGATLAGVDEVGRGPWAGPVVACAVLLKPEAEFETGDSKTLSPESRQAAVAHILPAARCFGVGIIGEEAIRIHGILNATRDAMEAALRMLSIQPERILVDGRVRLRVPGARITCLDKADGKSAAVASASILAKVIRDRLMADYDGPYPEFGFTRHFGYGTAEHSLMLNQSGPCPIHREGFRPVSEVRLFHGGIRKYS